MLNGNYPAYTDSRFISAATQLQNVTGAEELHFRFRHWFSYSSYDSGQVQISVWSSITGAWTTWQNVGNSIVGGSSWSLKDIDLTAYAGERVRIGFYHTATRNSYSWSSESTGWYIDDITITKL